MAQTKHTTGTELESNQLANPDGTYRSKITVCILILGFMLFYTGCEKQEDDLIRRMITGWTKEQKRNYNSHPARKHR